MRRVIIESPYAGDVDRNVAYARAAMRDCLLRGEAPYASHLLYTQPCVLDDGDPQERALGIGAGLVWGEAADLVAVYADLGVSPGMEHGIARHKDEGRTIEYRTLPGWVDIPVIQTKTKTMRLPTWSFTWRALLLLLGTTFSTVVALFGAVERHPFNDFPGMVVLALIILPPAAAFAGAVEYLNLLYNKQRD